MRGEIGRIGVILDVWGIGEKGEQEMPEASQMVGGVEVCQDSYAGLMSKEDGKESSSHPSLPPQLHSVRRWPLWPWATNG